MPIVPTNCSRIAIVRDCQTIANVLPRVTLAFTREEEGLERERGNGKERERERERKREREREREGKREIGLNMRRSG